MFGKTPKPEDLKLKEAHLSALDDLLAHEPGSNQHTAALEAVKVFTELQRNNKQRVDVNTALLVGGNLAGILLLVGYEHAHVVAATAKNFILKPHA